MIWCSHCQRDNDAEAIFCSYCGQRLTKIEQAPAGDVPRTGATIDLGRHAQAAPPAIPVPHASQLPQGAQQPQQAASHPGGTQVFKVLAVMLAVMFVPVLFVVLVGTLAATLRYIVPVLLISGLVYLVYERSQGRRHVPDWALMWMFAIPFMIITKMWFIIFPLMWLGGGLGRHGGKHC